MLGQSTRRLHSTARHSLYETLDEAILRPRRDRAALAGARSSTAALAAVLLVATALALPDCSYGRDLELLAPETVGDLAAGADSSIPRLFCATANRLLFAAIPRPFTGQELYSTEGPAESTLKIQEVGPYLAYGPFQFVGCGVDRRRAFFVAQEGRSGEIALWGSDGLPGGTELLLKPYYPGSHALIPGTARLVFYDTRDEDLGLWVSDGTSGGTFELVPFGPALQNWTSFASFNGFAYFLVTDATGTTHLWRTDGTSAGTTAVSTLPPSLGLPYFPWIVRDDGWLVARGLDPVPSRELALITWTGEYRPLTTRPSGFDLYADSANIADLTYFVDTNSEQVWVTDGTAAGTRSAFDYPRDFYQGQRLWKLGSSIYLPMASPETGSELWQIEPVTQRPEIFADLCPGACSSYPALDVTPSGAFVTTQADNPPTQDLYWLADGSLHGPLTPLCETECHSYDGYAGSLGGEVQFFSLNPEGEEGRLWSLDTSSYGIRTITSMLANRIEIAPGGDSTYGGALYFWGESAATGEEPWRMRLVPEPCVGASADELCLHATRFRVTVSWIDFIAAQGVGHPVSLTSDTGAFWFFDDANIELMLKIVDGSAYNGHFWVYYGALSNVEYWITVEDTVTGHSKTYHNALGEFGSFGDIEALPASGSPLAKDESPLSRSATADASDLLRTLSTTSGTCAPSSTRVCLLDGRFAVEGEWTDFDDNHGVAFAEAMTSDTGYLWFFDPDVAEIVVKLVDGSGFNGKFWVYYGSLSNVEFTIHVTDTVTGEIKPYHNPLGAFGSFGDIEAFPAP